MVSSFASLLTWVVILYVYYTDIYLYWSHKLVSKWMWFDEKIAPNHQMEISQAKNSKKQKWVGAEEIKIKPV